jgi:hypothetical protein
MHGRQANLTCAGTKIEFAPHEAIRHSERTAAERSNARRKDESGGNHLMAKGAPKVMSHRMFGALILSADQLMRLRQCEPRAPVLGPLQPVCRSRRVQPLEKQAIYAAHAANDPDPSNVTLREGVRRPDNGVRRGVLQEAPLSQPLSFFSTVGHWQSHVVGGASDTHDNALSGRTADSHG